MLRTTAGQLMVNHGLPLELRDYDRVLDKKGIEKLLQTVAEKHPDKYRDVVQHLSRVGYHTAQLTGGNSFGLEHMRTAVVAKQMMADLEKKVAAIHGNDSLSDADKEKQVVETLKAAAGPMQDAIYRETLSEGNPLGYQVLSGARGNPGNLRSLRGSDLLYVDHHNRPIPVPVLRSYSQGLRPVEYYAGTFGARKGVADTKFAVQDAGFASKQFNQMAHRLVVVSPDAENAPEIGAPRGLPVSIEDPDNEGALLAEDHTPYKRNQILTPKVLSDLRAKGYKRLLIRSPLVGGHASGGVYGRDVGVREKGGLPATGEMVGIAAAQALSEPLTQAQLSSKHSGGVAGAAKGVSGFALVNQLVQVPKVFKGGASHAQVDGKVTHIREAPQGGYYVKINGTEHYIGHGFEPKVKVGDEVEAGDLLSDGVGNPAEIVKHKGIGEGRLYLTQALQHAYKESGMSAHRRNLELLARGLVDHVELHTEMGPYVPGDIVPYHEVEHNYKPRGDHKLYSPKSALGKYLEKPVLHYSIGTKIRPSVVKTLEDFGVHAVAAHHEPPAFEPVMVRGMENLAHDPDWMTRFLGSYLKKNFQRGVHRGDVSDEKGTSFVASLARGVGFGDKSNLVRNTEPTGPLPSPPKPAPSILKQMHEVNEHSEHQKLSFAFIRPGEQHRRELLAEMLKAMKVEHPAGTKVQLADDDDEDWSYPLREVHYPVDHARLHAYKGEDGEPIAVLHGTDPKGESGYFRIHRPDPLQPPKTKFFHKCSPKEKDQVLRAFAPVLADHPVTFKRPEEMFDHLEKHHGG